MADKVVIDGIDISGCKFYKSNYTEDFNVRIKHYCSIQGGSCAACSDCDFKQNVQIAKQLEEREQECDELKKDVERWKSNFNGKVSAIEELIKIIQQALEDFSIEVGTPQYDRLFNGAKSLGIEVDNGTNP